MAGDDDELARLRRLVGPSEVSYGELRADLHAASEQLRRLEHEVGELRGRQTEMDVQLERARQDQERYQVWFERWRATWALPRRAVGKLRGTLKRS